MERLVDLFAALPPQAPSPEPEERGGAGKGEPPPPPPPWRTDPVTNYIWTTHKAGAGNEIDGGDRTGGRDRRYF